MCAAVKFSHARSRHLITCVTSKPVPTLLQRVVAFSWLCTISFEVHRSIGGVKIGITDTLYKSKKGDLLIKNSALTSWSVGKGLSPVVQVDQDGDQ